MTFRISAIAARHDWISPYLGELDKTAIHALYIADHPVFSDTDPWSWLAWAAGKTERIRLGTHVTGAPFHHPLRLAKQLVTVDVLSNGRATLGIGTGYEAKDFAPYGFEMRPFSDRITHLEELLTVIRQFYTGHSTGFDGRFIRLDGATDFAPLPVQKPNPPFVIGLNRPGKVMDIAGRQADAINTWQLSPQQVAELVEPLAEACIRAGRSADAVELTSDVIMLRNGTRAEAETLAHNIRDRTRAMGRNDKATDWGPDGIVYGDGDGICEQLEHFRAIGVKEITLSISNPEDFLWLDRDVVQRMGA
jgi:alkanesulfonate monooxygenase SsuD/methylene tetrahydromethanopterin reductase-like flavin-dependent oxidoreductase (luciferase family)